MEEAKVPKVDLDESNYEKLEAQFEEVSLFMASPRSRMSAGKHSR